MEIKGYSVCIILYLYQRIIYLLGIKETNFGESHEQMCESSLFLSGFPPSNKNHGEIGPKIYQVCPPSIE